MQNETQTLSALSDNSDLISENNLNVDTSEQTQEATDEKGKNTEKDKKALKKETQRKMAEIASAVKDAPKKYVLQLRKDQEALSFLIHEKLQEVGQSPVGDIGFEDIVFYLFEHKLEQSDYPKIREKALERKLEQARQNYNREYKTTYSLSEFLAVATSQYF